MGPAGLGPRTGRAVGYCAGYNVPGYLNPAPGFGGRRFLGRGRGFCQYWRFYFPTPPPYYVPYHADVPYHIDPKEEAKTLQDVASQLRKDLEAVEKRINELSNPELE